MNIAILLTTLVKKCERKERRNKEKKKKIEFCYKYKLLDLMLKLKKGKTTEQVGLLP